MASGGNNASTNQPGSNPRPSNSRDWMYVNTTKDSDRGNYQRCHVPNNLTTKNRVSGRDHYVHGKDKGRLNANKNIGPLYQQETASDKEDNYCLDQLNSNSSKPNLPPRMMAFPRTKFTASTRTASENGVRKKNSKFEEDMNQNMSKGEGDRRGDNVISNKKRPSQTNEEINLSASKNKQPNATSDRRVKENTGKMANTNEIFGRLVQIRENIKQVNVTIEALQSTGDPKVFKRIQKLKKILVDLQHSEQQLTHLLSATMEFNAENRKSEENNSDITSDESPDEFEKPNGLHQLSAANLSLPKSDERESKQKTNELLSKMKEYQEKLKLLQTQQAALAELQQKAENQLADTRAFHNQLSLECDENEDVHPMDAQTAAANCVQGDLDNLQQRINALQFMHDITLPAEGVTRSVEEDTKQGSSESVIELQRQELQHKLHDLQNKKNQMDELLKELSILRDMRSQQILKNDSLMRENVESGRESPDPSSGMKTTMDAAHELLESLDTTEKYKKLQDMKARLQNFQEMVAEYKSGVDACLQNAVTNEVQSSPPTLEARNIESRKDNVLPQKRLKSQKNDNISRDHSNEYLARGIYEHNQYSSERDPPRESNGANTNKKSLDEDFFLQEKRNQVQTARAKISTLQKLLEVLQDSQVDEINLNSAEEMLNGLDGNSNPSLAYHMTENERHIMTDGLGLDLGTGQEIPGDALLANDSRRNRSNSKISEDNELENLIEEEQKLMRIRDEFNKIKEHFPEGSVNATGGYRANESAQQLDPSVRLKDKTRSRSITPQKSNKQKVQSKQDIIPACEKNSLQNILPSTKISPEDLNEEDSDFLLSNQEIWSEMRQRLILREELQQKRRELEELMKKDHGKSNCRNQDNMSDNVSYSNKSEGLGMSFVGTEGTTAATWGGSTQGNPEDDQDDHNDSQEELEEIEDNEAYSSEGIGPVGDVPPSNCGNNLYPSRFPYKNSEQCRKIPGCKSRSIANNVVPAVNKKSKPNFKDMRNIWSKSVPHNESWSSHCTHQPQRQNANVETAEERRDSDANSVLNSNRNSVFWHQQAAYVQQQLDQVNGIQQAIMRDQQSFTNILQQSNANASPSSPHDVFRPHFTDIHQHYSQQLQQQQLFINLNHCCHLLYLQTLEIQQLQHQLHQVFRAQPSGFNYSPEEILRPTPSAISRPTDKPLIQNTAPPPLSTVFPSTHISAPSFPVCSSSGPSVIRSESFPCSLGNQQEIRPQTLNNQVAPGIRANNYWDNFRSYSRQNLLSTASMNKSNSGTRNALLTNPDNPQGLTIQGNLPVQHEPIVESSVLGVGNAEMAGNFQNVPVDSETQTSFLQFGAEYNASPFPMPKLELGNFLNKPKERKSLINQEQQKIEPKLSPQCLAVGSSITEGDAFKCGDGCGINGTAYLTNTSSSSAASLGSSAREMPFGPSYRECPMSNVESEDINDRSLFESLRESIYTEVGALISQNENRPHFLIQLFTELQHINSDDLRQTALVALRGLVSQVLSHNSSPSIRKPAKMTQTFWSEISNKTSAEPIPTESFMTSDDEELRSHLFKMNKPHRKQEITSLKRPQNLVSRHCDAMNENNFEKLLIMPAASEGGVADDNSLDPIQNKELNQPKKCLEASMGKGSPQHSAMGAAMYQAAADAVNSGVSDHNSDPSISDHSLAGLNTDKLDDHIQRIMLEIIPFLKAHLDDACSSKLLSYVCQLTIAVASDMEEPMELNQFFRKQLSSLLYETLMKYKGKRLRDCGEDLLVDLSEVLFNELAFLRLVQNMDSDVVNKLKIADDASQNHISNKHEEPPKNKLDGEEIKNHSKDLHRNYGANAQQPGECREMEATDADLTLHRTEEEDFSQLRDDAMAAACDMFDNEDASRASSSSSTKFAASADINDELRKLIPKNRQLPKEDPVFNVDVGKEQEFHSGEADGETEAEGLEDNQDLAEADQSQNQPIGCGHVGNVENHLDSGSQCSEEIIRAEATEDDQIQRHEENGLLAGNEELEAAVARPEQGLDEIPIKLCSMAEEGIMSRRQEEEMQNSIIQEILRDAVESELDENIIPIREPDSQ